MRRGAVDLNLLLVFEAILHDRSVSRAASRLGLSQPAISHALKRLRRMLDDELFVRTPAGMLPTARAEALAGPIRRALGGLEDVLEPERFVAATADRRFTIAMSNYATIVLGPPLVARCAVLAPGIQLTVRPGGTLDLVDGLDRGSLDLAFSSTLPHLERIGRTPLLSDDYVAVTRCGHPTSGRPLDHPLLAALPHLLVSSSPDDFGFVDRALHDDGLARRVAVKAPFLATGEIVMQSDLIAILARNVAGVLARSHAIEVREIPMQGDRLVVSMHWARRLDRHLAHRWLRELVCDIARARPGGSDPIQEVSPDRRDRAAGAVGVPGRGGTNLIKRTVERAR